MKMPLFMSSLSVYVMLCIQVDERGERGVIREGGR